MYLPSLWSQRGLGFKSWCPPLPAFGGVPQSLWTTIFSTVKWFHLRGWNQRWKLSIISGNTIWCMGQYVIRTCKFPSVSGKAVVAEVVSCLTPGVFKQMAESECRIRVGGFLVCTEIKIVLGVLMSSYNSQKTHLRLGLGWLWKEWTWSPPTSTRLWKTGVHTQCMIPFIKNFQKRQNL